MFKMLKRRARLFLAEWFLPDTHLIVRNFSRPAPVYIELSPREFRRLS